MQLESDLTAHVQVTDDIAVWLVETDGNADQQMPSMQTNFDEFIAHINGVGLSVRQ
jgi:hypothetical protein